MSSKKRPKTAGNVGHKDKSGKCPSHRVRAKGTGVGSRERTVSLRAGAVDGDFLVKKPTRPATKKQKKQEGLEGRGRPGSQDQTWDPCAIKRGGSETPCKQHWE